MIRAAVLGLGRAAVVGLPVDSDGRIELAALRARLEADRSAGIVPVAIVATAGTVNTGAVDPIDPMADLTAEFGTCSTSAGPSGRGRRRGVGRVRHASDSDRP